MIVDLACLSSLIFRESKMQRECMLELIQGLCIYFQNSFWCVERKAIFRTEIKGMRVGGVIASVSQYTDEASIIMPWRKKSVPLLYALFSRKLARSFSPAGLGATECNQNSARKTQPNELELLDVTFKHATLLASRSDIIEAQQAKCF